MPERTFPDDRGLPKRGRRLWPFASLSSLLLGGLLASRVLAVDGVGCVASPFHGTAIPVATGAYGVNVEIAGQVNVDTVEVTVELGSPGSTPNQFRGGTVQLGGLPVDNANDGFRGVINVPRSLWRDDDVVGLRLTERLANGTRQVLDTHVNSGTRTNHKILGLADRPDVGKFPENRPDVSTVSPTSPFPGQERRNPFLVIANTKNEAATYYNEQPQIPRTLDEFYASDGMVIPQMGAIYKNEGDLGFGRRMICGTSQPNSSGFFPVMACAVSNYVSADAALEERGTIATVAMNVYPTGTAEPRYVVYGNTGARLETVALDAGGKKPVPNLCLNCHGGRLIGNPSVSAVRTHDSRFLPFDLDMFSIPTSVTNVLGDQAAQFKALNQFVFLTEYTTLVTKGFTSADGQPNGAMGPNLALMDLIAGWYQSSGGLFSAESRFDKTYVPAGWSGNDALYLSVVAPYCRGCHIANAPNLEPQKAGVAPFDFASFANFQANKAKINATVCNQTGFTMPHAQRVYHRFWASGASAVLAFDLGFPSCKMRPL